MRYTKYVSTAVLTVAALFGFAPLALATVTPNSTDASHAAGFEFYCQPYSTSFVEGGEYIPKLNDAICDFSVPSTIVGNLAFEVDRGTVGSATFVSGGTTPSSSYTLYDVYPYSFSLPVNSLNVPDAGTDFFAVVYDSSLGTAFRNYIRSGAAKPAAAVEGTNYYILRWKWAAPPPTDTDAPVITITTPAQGSTYLSTDSVVPAATITDASAIATSTYTFNGTAVDPLLPLPLAGAPLGAATLSVKATDAAGNTGSTAVNFTIASPDTVAPVITITNPTQGATYFDTATVPFNATITDDSPIAATSYTFNGNPVDPGQPLPLLNAPLGPATVSVTATDSYGNAASTTVSFTIISSDVLPPTITITTPANGATYQNTAVVVPAVTITDPSGVATSSFYLNGNLINRTQPLPLTTVAAGPATFSVSATDVYGNSTTTSTTFTITAPPPPDTRGPSVTINKPKNGALYARSDKIYADVKVTDASAVTSVKYYLNSKSVDITKPLTFMTAPLGTSVFVVKATDEFGNIGYATSTFRVIPAPASCISDITEAFDHKWIPNKLVFLTLFAKCKLLDKLWSDHDKGARNDDDIDRVCHDMDQEINRDDKEDQANGWGRWSSSRDDDDHTRDVGKGNGR